MRDRKSRTLLRKREGKKARLARLDRINEFMYMQCTDPRCFNCGKTKSEHLGIT